MRKIALVASLLTVALVSQAMALESTEARRLRMSHQAEDIGSQGDQALAAKEYDRAIELYGQAISSGGLEGEDLGKIYFHRGLAYQGKQDCATAVTDFTKASETLKNNGELYYNESLCHAALNQPDVALADLNNAIKVNPDSMIYRVGRCVILFNKQDFAGALPDCEVTLTAAPDDPKMLYATAMSAEQTGDKARAAKYYKHLLDLDHGNTQASEGLKRVGG